MGFLEVLTIVFVACKLMGLIDWSWWLVLSPIIAALTFYLIFLIFVFIPKWRSFKK